MREVDAPNVSRSLLPYGTYQLLRSTRHLNDVDRSDGSLTSHLCLKGLVYLESVRSWQNQHVYSQTSE